MNYDEKQNLYFDLVKKRKSCRDCMSFGLINQNQVNKGKYDKNEVIGAWSLWQGSLEAKILVVGQDWGDIASFERDRGQNGFYKDVTNTNLVRLFKSIGIDVEEPGANIQNPLLFFTNAVLCLKENGMSTKISQKCYNNCADKFLKEIIEMIRPRIIITLGQKAYECTARVYDVAPKPYRPLLNSIMESRQPIDLPAAKNLPEAVLFPAPHCGQYSTNTFIKISDQENLWKVIKNDVQFL